MRLHRFISCPPAGITGASLTVLALLLLSGCENNLQDVEKISAKKLSLPVDKSTGVTVLYSDSAFVKAKMITPEYLHYKTEKPYIEMKKGVTVIFYDTEQQETSRVTSDYAIRRENEKLVELRRNVVATNNKGQTFKSEELIWDETKGRFFSNQLVSVTSPGNTMYGKNFWATQDFSYYEIDQASGDLSLTKKQGF